MIEIWDESDYDTKDFLKGVIKDLPKLNLLMGGIYTNLVVAGMHCHKSVHKKLRRDASYLVTDLVLGCLIQGGPNGLISRCKKAADCARELVL